MRRGRAIPNVTPEALEKAAYAYLERFASSAENLRRVLMRRVERAARAQSGEEGTIERETGARLVQAVIDRLVARRLLDDKVYAEARARSLGRQGRSKSAIAQRLALKGVDSEIVGTAMEALAEDGHSDLRGALILARKRRLGPFRPKRERKERRDRDLAALGRAGFSFETAKKVIDAESAEAIEGEIEDK
jgi:regulatory protein